MKTVGYQDVLGGCIHLYKNVKKPKQKRWERFYEALSELKHTGNIIIYRYEKRKLKRLKFKGM